MGSSKSGISFLKLVDKGVFLVIGTSRTDPLLSFLLAVHHALCAITSS